MILEFSNVRITVWRREISSTNPSMFSLGIRILSPSSKGLNREINIPLTRFPTASCAAKPKITANMPELARKDMTNFWNGSNCRRTPDTPSTQSTEITILRRKVRWVTLTLPFLIIILNSLLTSLVTRKVSARIMILPINLLLTANWDSFSMNCCILPSRFSNNLWNAAKSAPFLPQRHTVLRTAVQGRFSPLNRSPPAPAANDLPGPMRHEDEND